MNKDRLRAELVVYSRKAREALLRYGHTEEEIGRALKGQLSGTRFFPGVDDGVVEQDYLWLECLRRYTDARENLERGHVEAARAEYAEGREFMLEARIGNAAIHGFEDLSKRKKAAVATNAKWDKSKSEARDYAQKLIAENPDTINKRAIIDQVSDHLIANRIPCPKTEETLWGYLKAEPSVVPEYLTRPGPRKRFK